MADRQVPILEFENPVFQQGRNTTVRRGDRWHGVAQARLRWADGSLSAPLPLVTELKTFNSLQPLDLGFEHDASCRNREGLLTVLQQVYPGFSPEEDVTLCHFDLP